MIRKLTRNPIAWAIVGVLVAGAAFGLYWFAPWRLVTSSTVNEALPTFDPTVGPTGATSAPTGNVLLANGALITHEHDTSGTVRLVRLADGRVQLLLADLVTSDGPDLHVWLTDQRVIAGSDGWRVFDDGQYIELGPLKANKGNQVYDLPANTDLRQFTSVTIWCKRFAVSFGAAQLVPA